MSSDENDIKYTEPMEKGLRQTHGFGHEVLKKSLDKKIEVEKVREKEHKKSLEVEHELNRKFNR
ncbi:hypothetical protein LGQ02_21110 [Bacillus shivajii]|uniref:hypothetical protein n=1 Tax=Bacillus shivajii TaxID=1983719 RepID=UPI001CFA5E9A|nr:hypothetical protein [Bacillus shivajii]UCZ53234.1 hypothetical protein LGQ02_21110 [Bacillus shivajii]